MSTRATVSVSAVAASNTVPLNINGYFPCTVQISGVFVGTYNIEYTLDNVLNSVPATWSAAPTGSGLTVPGTVRIDFPVCAMRLNVTAYTSGTVVAKVLQGDNLG